MSFDPSRILDFIGNRLPPGAETVPSLPEVPSSLDPATQRFLSAVKDAISTSSVTWAGLVNRGFARSVDSTFIPAFPEGSGDVTMPPAPTTVAANGAMTNIFVTWDMPTYSNHAFAEVWGAAVDNLSIAVRLGTTTGAIYADYVGTNTARYYWVRFVSTANVNGPFNSTAGTLGTTGFVDTNNINNVAITIQKIKDKRIAVTGDTWTDDSPSAGSVAWSSMTIVYNGTIYTISSGNTANKWIYWTSPNTTLSTAASFPTLSDSSFLVAVNNTGAHDMVWNANGIATQVVDTALIANLAVGTAQIGNAAITNAKVNDLAADKITAGNIATARMTANFLSAAQATITQLSAVVADLGAITAGTITLSSSGYIRSGQTDYATGTGFFLGINGGASKFSIGSSTQYLRWDGSSLLVGGSIIGNGNIQAQAITVDKLLVGAPGAALNDDPGFADASAWTAFGGYSKLAFVTITDGAVGTTASRGAAASPWAMYSKPVPYDPTKVYRVRCYARSTSSGNVPISVGIIYWDSTGPTSSVAGTNCIPAAVPASSWTAYTATAAANAGGSTARTMSVYISANGGTTGNFEIQDLRVEEAVPTTLIVDGAITAAKISVTSLSAIQAEIGDLIITSTGSLRSGQTAFATGTGFWLGTVSGTPKFSIGSSTKYMKWDGTDLTVTGLVADLRPYTAGTILIAHAPKLITHSNTTNNGDFYNIPTTLTIMKAIDVPRGGTVTVEFQMYADVNGAEIEGKLYKNGTAVGTLRTCSGHAGSWQTFTEDITVSAGDSIQLWGRVTVSGSSTHNVYSWKNLRLKCGFYIAEVKTLDEPPHGTVVAPPGTGGGSNDSLHPHSFVLMADGSEKAVCDVRPGDKVMGENGPATVVGVKNCILGFRKYVEINGSCVITPGHLMRSPDGWCVPDADCYAACSYGKWKHVKSRRGVVSAFSALCKPADCLPIIEGVTKVLNDKGEFVLVERIRRFDMPQYSPVMSFLLDNSKILFVDGYAVGALA
jgi:hypothetical protein